MHTHTLARLADGFCVHFFSSLLVLFKLWFAMHLRPRDVYSVCSSSTLFFFAAIRSSWYFAHSPFSRLCVFVDLLLVSLRFFCCFVSTDFFIYRAILEMKKKIYAEIYWIRVSVSIRSKCSWISSGWLLLFALQFFHTFTFGALASCWWFCWNARRSRTRWRNFNSPKTKQ